MKIDEVYAQLMSIPKFSADDTFSNTKELVRRLMEAEAQGKIPMKVIHVAGTNGKGSVCAFTTNILVEAGYKVGLFTSPHLLRMNERFQINNQPVTDDVFIRAFEKVMAVSEEMLSEGFVKPTFFDVLFAMAIVIFSEEKVDYAVMETGMGGRRDATNVIQHPLATIITSISLDHTEILGDTIAKIAYEKAGIIKEEVPIIFDARCAEAAEVILAEANKKHANAVLLSEEMFKIVKTSDSSIDFQLNVPYYEGCKVTVPYVAPYQVVNSALALLAIEKIDPQHKIPLSVRLAGIRNTRWQGRMETVLPGVIVDGAHNEDGIREFVRTLKQVRENRRIVLLFSAVVEKNYKEMIRTICDTGCFDEVVVTEIKGSRVVDTEVLAEVFRSYTMVPVYGICDVKEAFRTAYEKKLDGLLFCVGSLYLVGEVKKILEEK